MNDQDYFTGNVNMAVQAECLGFKSRYGYQKAPIAECIRLIMS